MGMENMSAPNKRMQEALPGPERPTLPKREGIGMEPDCGPMQFRRHDNTLPPGGSASQGRGGPKHA
jgi:hypothetical protein